MLDLSVCPETHLGILIFWKGCLLLVLRFSFALVLTAFFTASCGESTDASAERWLLEPTVPLPAELSNVGLFEDTARRAPYDDVVGYKPKHPLYSNGLAKERHLYLPSETRIEAGETDAWRFPIGTVLAKTFVYEGAAVETRLIFKTDEGWDYAIYQWREDASDAERLTGNWAEVSVSLGDGDLMHTLPSRLDCRTCHETHEAVAGVPVLGVSSLQTGDDLVEADVFAADPALQAVEGRSDEETAALSYFIGNCTSCHNGGDALNSGFSLYPDVAVANTVDQPTESETGEGIRVVPGRPDESAVFITVVDAPEPGYGGAFKAMPPIGLSRVDPRAEEALSSWIEGL